MEHRVFENQLGRRFAAIHLRAGQAQSARWTLEANKFQTAIPGVLLGMDRVISFMPAWTTGPAECLRLRRRGLGQVRLSAAPARR
jgi:hypothetical protein